MGTANKFDFWRNEIEAKWRRGWKGVRCPFHSALLSAYSLSFSIYRRNFDYMSLPNRFQCIFGIKTKVKSAKYSREYLQYPLDRCWLPKLLKLRNFIPSLDRVRSLLHTILPSRLLPLGNDTFLDERRRGGRESLISWWSNIHHDDETHSIYPSFPSSVTTYKPWNGEIFRNFNQISIFAVRIHSRVRSTVDDQKVWRGILAESIVSFIFDFIFILVWFLD